MVISAFNLTKKFKKFTAVDRISFEIKENEIFGLLGSNGAGKTTTINMMTGIIKPTSGYITVFGKNLNSNLQELRKKLGLVPQTLSIYEDLSIYENLEFFGKLYIKNKSDLNQKIEELLKLFGLNTPDKFVKNLSGGYKRRTSIAIALINNPEIIFLDEPTTGIDIVTNEIIMDFIKKRKKHSSVILTTHSIAEAQNICDTVAIMHQGKIIISGNVEKIIQQYAKYVGEEVSVELYNEDDAFSMYSKLKKYDLIEITQKGEKVIMNVDVKEFDNIFKLLTKISKFKKPIKDLNISKPGLDNLIKRAIKNQNENNSSD